jgi:hypothetical protein
MRRVGIIAALVIALLSCSGCVGVMVGLIRWDQKRYKAQQEKKREGEKAQSAGGGTQADGRKAVPEVHAPAEEDKREDEVPVPSSVGQE